MTIVGTRPELIRLSRVISRLSDTARHVLVHSGQNRHPALRDDIFADLDLPAPDYRLRAGSSSLGRMLGDILTSVEEVIAAERPDAVLLLGDTNTCVAALMARRMRVPTYHMEAGNRSFDLNVPEETNRRFVDHVSDFHLVYTEHARRNLLAEGIEPRRILLTGSPMREVLHHYSPAVRRSDVLTRTGLAAGGYFLVSAHREENVDDPARLGALLDCLRAVRDRWGLPVVVTTHPRTRDRLAALGEDADLKGIELHEPFGFVDYVRLQMAAQCVLSDSGTISEESAICGFPAVALREWTERPESVDAGTVIMTGLDPGAVVEAVAVTLRQAVADGVPCAPEYRIADTSRRVVNFILSTVRRHHEWAGVRRSTDHALGPGDGA
jgi:UDP-N-acetylglucosamine 2-epimerase (non-hydrolysing)